MYILSCFSISYNYFVILLDPTELEDYRKYSCKDQVVKSGIVFKEVNVDLEECASMCKVGIVLQGFRICIPLSSISES